MRISKAEKAKKEKQAEIWRKQYCASLREGLSPPLITSQEKLRGVCSTKSILDNRWKRGIDPDMDEREMVAQKEIERRCNSVAPTYSKGPLQPISISDIETLGRKI